jgi:FkbM family methyltransferase
MKPAPIDPPEIHAYLWDGYDGEIGWDVGANCGQTVPTMLDRYHMVFAFEPAEECQPYLHGLAKIHPELAVMPFALSDTDDGIELVAIPDKIDTGQLVTDGVCGMEWSPDSPGAHARQIPSYTVDTLAEHYGPPCFMKIDTEGHEARVLFGARKTLAVFRPQLLIEFHSPELRAQCIDVLKAYDYHIETVRHPHYPTGSDFWHQHGWLKARQENQNR